MVFLREKGFCKDFLTQEKFTNSFFTDPPSSIVFFGALQQKGWLQQKAS
jgi:hypothetical protein